MILGTSDGCHRRHLRHAEIDWPKTNEVPQGMVYQACPSSVNKTRGENEETYLPCCCGNGDKGDDGELAEVTDELLVFAHPSHTRSIFTGGLGRSESAVLILQGA